MLQQQQQQQQQLLLLLRLQEVGNKVGGYSEATPYYIKNYHMYVYPICINTGHFKESQNENWKRRIEKRE